VVVLKTEMRNTTNAETHLLSRNNNKMQLCNRIYYSKVYWRLNIFWAAHRSSSGALNSVTILIIHLNQS